MIPLISASVFPEGLLRQIKVLENTASFVKFQPFCPDSIVGLPLKLQGKAFQNIFHPLQFIGQGLGDT